MSGFLRRSRLFQWVTSATLPDPDGAGPLSSPIYFTYYNKAGQVIVAEDAEYHLTRYNYDTLGRLVRVVQPDPDGAGPLASPVLQYGYDKNGNLTQERDPAGALTYYGYDGLDRLTSVRQPNPTTPGLDGTVGPVYTYAYDLAGQLTSQTDPLGAVTRFEYDALGRRTKVTLPSPTTPGAAGAATEYVYDKLGDLTAVHAPVAADGLLRNTAYEYNALGWLTKVTLPDPDGAGTLPSPVIQYEYDLAGQKTKMTDQRGAATGYAYDGMGRVTTVTLPDPVSGLASGPATSFTYDAMSHVTTKTDPLGKVTTYGYDHLGRLIQATQPDPDGNPATDNTPYVAYTYYADGELHTETDALGHGTTYVYDQLDRLKTSTDALGHATSYGYDVSSNLHTLADPDQNVTTYGYDRLNRLVTETDQLSHSRLYEYNDAGSLTKRTDRNGRVIEFSYNYLQQPTVETWKDGQTTVRTTSYLYDGAGRLYYIADQPLTYQLYYDALDRLTLEKSVVVVGVVRYFVTSGYNASGDRNILVAQVNVTRDFREDYSYDKLGRPTQTDQQTYTGGHAVAPKLAKFYYDADSRMTSLARYNDLGATQLVSTATYGYDDASRLTSLVHTKGATTLASYAYTYDRANRITQTVVSPSSAETVTYGYDNTDQLTSATYTNNPPANETYAYDSNGNRNNGGFTPSTENRLSSDGTYNYEYDNEGNVTRRTNIATGAVTDYTWDWRNRLTTVTDRASLNGAATHVVTYSYDYRNRVLTRAEDPDGAGPQSSINRRYLYDGDRRIAELNSDSDATTHRYISGPAVDQVLADEAPTDMNQPGPVLWALTDLLGSVRDIAQYNPVPNTTTIIDHRVLDSYGKIVSETAPATDFIFAYAGRPLDKATGKQYNLNRWYDPPAERWSSEDPAGMLARDPNYYRYVWNSPTNRTDPSGLAPDVGAYVAAEAATVSTAATQHQQSFQRLLESASRLQAALCNPGNQQALQRAQQTFIQRQQELSAASGRLTGAIEMFGRNVTPDMLAQGGAKVTQAQGLVNNAAQQIPNFGNASNNIAALVQRITAPLRSFDSFDAFKRGMGSPGENGVWHHIVEQRSANLTQFGARVIHSTQNCVPVARDVNQALANYYASIQRFTDGLTVRKWLETQSFEDQYQFGMDILFRVLSGQPLP